MSLIAHESLMVKELSYLWSFTNKYSCNSIWTDGFFSKVTDGILLSLYKVIYLHNLSAHAPAFGISSLPIPYAYKLYPFPNFCYFSLLVFLIYDPDLGLSRFLWKWSLPSHPCAFRSNTQIKRKRNRIIKVIVSRLSQYCHDLLNFSVYIKQRILEVGFSFQILLWFGNLFEINLFIKVIIY